MTHPRDRPRWHFQYRWHKVIRINWGDGGAVATKTALDLPASRAVATSIEHTVGYPPIKLPILGASSGMADIVGQLHVPMVGVSVATMTTTSMPKTRICGSATSGTASKSMRVCSRT